MAFLDSLALPKPMPNGLNCRFSLEFAAVKFPIKFDADCSLGRRS